MTADRAVNQSAAAAALATMEGYLEAFEKADLAAIDGFMRYPVTYIAEDRVLTRDRYPFDPAKLKAKTGYDHSRVDIDVVAGDDKKVHLHLKGTRHRADGSVIEGIDSIYILQQVDGDWRIVAFSGIRTPA